MSQCPNCEGYGIIEGHYCNCLLGQMALRDALARGDHVAVAYNHQTGEKEVFRDMKHKPASAPSPEELARDKFAELRTFLTNMRRDAADAEDPELSEYAQAIEQRLDEIAALLRSRMAERWIPVGEMLPESDGWYQIYPADVNNPANPKDLPFSFEYWLRREQERRGKGWCGCNTVTHWRRLPSAPDTERL